MCIFIVQVIIFMKLQQQFHMCEIQAFNTVCHLNLYDSTETH